MTKQIHFLFRLDLDGYVFNPHRPEGLDFADPASGTKFRIRSKGKEGDSGFGHSDLEIIAEMSCSATEQQIGFVESLIDDRIVRPGDTPAVLPYFSDENLVISSDGKISEGYSPNLDFFTGRLERSLYDKRQKAGKISRPVFPFNQMA